MTMLDEIERRMRYARIPLLLEAIREAAEAEILMKTGDVTDNAAQVVGEISDLARALSECIEPGRETGASLPSPAPPSPTTAAPAELPRAVYLTAAELDSQDWFRLRSQERGRSQSWLARRCGISRQSVSHWEKGYFPMPEFAKRWYLTGREPTDEELAEYHAKKPGAKAGK
jgi:hypothetical protein